MPSRGKNHPLSVGLDRFPSQSKGGTQTRLTVTGRSADGSVVARRSESFQFDKWYPDDPGCRTWVLRHETRLTGSDRI